MKAQVIEILKRSDQELVFLDAIITPVRSLGLSEDELHEIVLQLKSAGVIDHAGGFWSYYRRRVIITSVSLNEDWFRANCRWRPTVVQLSLFS